MIDKVTFPIDMRLAKLVVDKREPLTLEMMDTLYHLIDPDDPDSLYSCCYNWFICGLYGGFRLSEWAQPTHTELDRPQIDPAGEPIAFCLSDVEFRLEGNRLISLRQALLLPTDRLRRCRLRFSHQKNGRHGEVRSFSSNDAKPRICFIRNFLTIVRRFVRLVGWRFDVPLAIFCPAGGSPQPITASFITQVLQETAAITYDLSPTNPTHQKHLRQWSSHSLRVGACVILHSQGFSTTQIKFLLRWRSDSFMEYLRNLNVLSQQQNAAISLVDDMPNVL